MTSGVAPQGKGIGPLLFGGSLIVVGFLLFLFQTFGIEFGLMGRFWPLFVIVPGLLLFAAAVATRKQGGESLATIGTVVTFLGLLLFYQNTTGHWENWAYAWALLVPFAVGLGQMLFGLLTQQRALTKSGSRLLVIGAVIFLVGFFFFEVVLGIGGLGIARFGVARFSWPILLVGIGVLVLLFGSLEGRGSRARDSQ